MGNTCTAPSYPVPELEAPSELPGNKEEIDALIAATTVHLPGTKDYDFCRKDRSWLLDPVTFGRPAAIVVPKSAEEIVAAIKYATAAGIKVSVACGRHTHESVRQGVLLIDMTHGLNEVTVDAERKTVTVQGGANIGKVDAACAPHKFILPVGRIGTTGCAGQMLTTGAHGYCERLYGLGIDYLTSATVVTGQGEVLTCSASENTELFWAIRGGGANFGVVVDMTFTPAQAPNDGKFLSGSHVFLTIGALGFPTRQQVMDYLLTCMDADKMPREYSCSATFVGGGINPVIVSHFWFGADQEAGRVFFKDHVKKVGFCVADTIGVHGYWGGIQKWASGPKGDQAGPGAYYYRGVMPSVFNAEIGRMIVEACKGPFPKGVQPVVLVDLMGGKACDVPIGAMALPARPKYWVVILCNWKPEVTGPSGRDFSANWVRSLWQGIVNEDAKHNGAGATMVDNESHAGIALELAHAISSNPGSAEVSPTTVAATEQNTMTMGQQAHVRKLWGDHEPRMQAAKALFDPHNVFGGNIPPVATSPAVAATNA